MKINIEKPNVNFCHLKKKAKKNHVTSVFLVEYFLIYAQNKAYYTIVI